MASSWIGDRGSGGDDWNVRDARCLFRVLRGTLRLLDESGREVCVAAAVAPANHHAFKQHDAAAHLNWLRLRNETLDRPAHVGACRHATSRRR